MATRFPGRPDQRQTRAGRASVYDFAPDGLVNGIFFRILLLVAPIQSVLLLPVQGSTAAFLLALLSPAILIGPDPRYGRLLAFYFGFAILYALYMALSLSGYMIDEPDMSSLTVIREVYIWGHLKQTHVTQGTYLWAAAVFSFLIYQYYQESFIKYAFYGIMIIVCYGFYEFIFYAIFHVNGDFLSNRNFGDLNTAAAGAGHGDYATGSVLQQSNLFGPAFMRLKSLAAEPSMYALSVTPFAVYAYGRRWWWIFAILATSLVLSTSTTGLIGLLVGLLFIQMRQRQEAVLYVAAGLIVIALLYITVDPVYVALNKLLFDKLDTVSGSDRIQSFVAQASVPFDGNPIRALFGLGFGTVRATDMMSNLLANVGILGLLGYSSLILLPCFLIRQGIDRAAIIGTLLAIFAMEMLTVSEYSYLPPWFMIALGFVRLREQKPLLARQRVG